MATLNAFLYGVLASLAFLVGVFFLRYWRNTGDRFFVFLAITFWGLAGNWASLANTADDHAAYYYLPRLAAFVILLIGIVDKNRRS